MYFFFFLTIIIIIIIIIEQFKLIKYTYLEKKLNTQLSYYLNIVIISNTIFILLNRIYLLYKKIRKKINYSLINFKILFLCF